MNWAKEVRVSHEVEGFDFSLCQGFEVELFNSARESTIQPNSLNPFIFIFKLYSQKISFMKFFLLHLFKKNVKSYKIITQ